MWSWTKSRPRWRRAFLTGHSHHIVGLGGTGSGQHHQFLLAADVTVHHGAHRPVSWGGAGGGSCRHYHGAGLRLVQDADGAVLANAVGHFEGVHPERELTGQQQVELLYGQANTLPCLAYQRVHLVVDADAAITWTLAGSVWKPVVLIVLCRDTEKRNGKRKISFGGCYQIYTNMLCGQNESKKKKKNTTANNPLCDYRCCRCTHEMWNCTVN